ncbi:MAG: cupin domain-containing protein [Candidatus Dormibacteraeota bacterium]|nr:cupin domain-containing protein [Candidatus Dormibacteraeota bacterium]MBV9526540.1 cupin domain-containing protein [Candidatus Dormibacteraeota bacterium]
MTEAAAEHADFYEDVARLNAVPLWSLAASTSPEPRVFEQPHVWRWSDLYPQLLRAAEVVEVGTEQAERRVLTFKNPGLPPMAVGATQTLVASLQILLPGETAPAHRHTYNALRFILSGSGCFTTVEGEAIPMNRGDLVLTPHWKWHDHAHDGQNEPMVWMDGLDFPFVLNLRSAFYEDYPGKESQAVTRRSGENVAQFGGGIVGQPWRRDGALFSPLLVYSWDAARGALQRLQDTTEADPWDGYMIEYLNTASGGHVLATMAAYLHLLPAGFRSRPQRRTPSSVFCVVSGSGFSVVAGQKLEWSERDIVALPGWSWHEHVVEKDTVLFRMSDVPMLEPFGLVREQRAERLPASQPEQQQVAAGAGG